MPMSTLKMVTLLEKFKKMKRKNPVPDKISLIIPETMEKSRNIEKNLLITLERESFGFLFI
jgi:hypothetical protein